MGRALFRAAVRVVKLGQGLGIQSSSWAGCMAKSQGSADLPFMAAEVT